MTRPRIIDDSDLSKVLAAFYDAVRQDDLLGPVFNDAVENWDDHLARLADFWSSVMGTTGRYKGEAPSPCT